MRKAQKIELFEKTLSNLIKLDSIPDSDNDNDYTEYSEQYARYSGMLTVIEIIGLTVEYGEYVVKNKQRLQAEIERSVRK